MKTLEHLKKFGLMMLMFLVTFLFGGLLSGVCMLFGMPMDGAEPLGFIMAFVALIVYGLTLVKW